MALDSIASQVCPKQSIEGRRNEGRGNNRTIDIFYLLLITSYLLPLTYYPLTYYLLPITSYLLPRYLLPLPLLPLTYYLLPLTYYLLPLTYYLLPLTYYLLLIQMFLYRDRFNLIPRILLATLLTGVFLPEAAIAQGDLQSFKVVVNSDLDEINPDRYLTLREAIGIVNNTLTWGDLSPTEQEQVTTIYQWDASRIEFDFAEPVTIELNSLLPPLISPGLVIDGTSHPDYDPNSTTTAEIEIPIPVVTITPASDRNIFRGLSIMGDRITVKGFEHLWF